MQVKLLDAYNVVDFRIWRFILACPRDDKDMSPFTSVQDNQVARTVSGGMLCEPSCSFIELFLKDIIYMFRI